MISHLRVVFCRGQHVAARSQVRNMADWHKPNFLGGKAQPHELGRMLRQRLYAEGDIIFYMVGAMTLFSAGILWGIFSETKYAERKARSKEYVNNAHYLAYPYPVRDEGDK